MTEPIESLLQPLPIEQTPTGKTKGCGLGSIRDLAKTLNKAPQTLINWYHHNPLLFDAVVIGLASMNKGITIKKIQKDTNSDYLKQFR